MKAKRGLDLAVQAVERIKARHPEVDLWIGHGKFGGHGDTAVAIAHARAARRWAAETFPGANVGHMVLAKTTGSQTDIDLFRGSSEFLVGYVCIPDPGWHDAVLALRPCFEVYHDVQYVVGTYLLAGGKLGPLGTSLAIEAEQRLRPFSRFYSGFPLSNNELGAMWPVTQWELMSRTGLFDVSPADLWVPVAEPTVGFGEWNVPTTSRSWRWAHQFADRLDRCVVIHAGAGGHGSLKVPSLDVFAACAAAAWGRGYTPIQVGIEGEAVVPGCVDGRGLSLPETAWLVGRATLLVCAEGFLAYVARVVSTRSLTFFGPTPTGMFGFFEERAEDGTLVFPGHVNHSEGKCSACWWLTGGGWDGKCPKANRTCANFPGPGEAQDLTVRVLLACEANPWPRAADGEPRDPEGQAAVQDATAANGGGVVAKVGEPKEDEDGDGTRADGGGAAELQQSRGHGEGGEGDPRADARRDPLDYL